MGLRIDMWHDNNGGRKEVAVRGIVVLPLLLALSSSEVVQNKNPPPLPNTPFQTLNSITNEFYFHFRK
jgi:hypothetical protein